MQYRNLRTSDGTALEGSIRYSFGCFPKEPGTPFFFVEDVEGDLIDRTQSSPGSFEFLGLISLLNAFFDLGYEISKLQSGLHKIDLVVLIKSEWNIKRYKRIFLDADGTIAIKDYPGGHEDFISDYLKWPSEKKISYLAEQ